jgi:cephalosporin-C deacetylase-like acetyl esterase
MRSTSWMMVFGVWCVIGLRVDAAGPVKFPDVFPGSKKLELDQPLDEFMVAGIDTFALREIELAAQARAGLWKRDAGSPEAYDQSLAPYRDKLREYIGAVDPRVTGRSLEDLTFTHLTGIRAAGSRPGDSDAGDLYSISPCRWQVLDGVTAEGVVLRPLDDEIVGLVIAIPDAAWTPEQFCGADPDQPEATPLPRLLAEEGFLVVIPTLISRDVTFSGNPLIAMTNQTHREWVYRSAFELGRHVIGYEVQKILAAVDALEHFNAALDADLPICVAGVGEGGLLALYSSALDPRIDATLVSGYFQPREGVWQEPIERNVWRQLTLFGDAELAGMIAPRPLIIEACSVPEITTPLPTPEGRRAGAAPGSIKTASLDAVKQEFAKAEAIYKELSADDAIHLVSNKQGEGPPGSRKALAKLYELLKLEPLPDEDSEPLKLDVMVDTADRQRRQVQELVDFTQQQLKFSYRVRDKLWHASERTTVENWSKFWPTVQEKLRQFTMEELIGKLPDPTLPPNPRTRKVLDEKEFTGYEVMLDVYPDIVAGGILLLPKGLKDDEKRPVVVCQHGLEGVPMDTISGPGSAGYPYYKSFAAELAKQGFITYAPQNPYRGKDRFRTLQRKSNPLGRSLFSYIIPQHQVTLNWLAGLPFVDPERIAFYGLSYGGKTAVRVPPMVKDYCLSICSADFNEWVSKNASTDFPNSYVFTGEYEIFEWNMGHVANYAELSYLMTPRPFMVERGHDDGVGIDEWVAWEYAKVRRHYVKLGLGDKTEIEFFNGPHTINGQGTYDFLHRHLKWPK